MGYIIEDKATVRFKCCQCGREQRFIPGEDVVCQFCRNTVMKLLKNY